MEQGPTVQIPTYRAALALAIVTPLLLLWLIGAVGVIGIEGDPFDRWYFAVIGLGIVGAIIARLRPRGMAIALSITALAQASVAVLALIIGKQHVPVSSVGEIVGLNGFFVVLFAASAWLFRRAAREQSPLAF